MKKLVLLTAALVSSGLCLAQEIGRVISSTPIIQASANRPVAYNVVYEYAGKQYTVQLPSDPGATLQLQVSPVGAVAQMAPPQGTVTYAAPVYTQPVYAQPSYVVVAPEVYPGYYQPGYYQPNYFLPFALGLGLGGFWGGGHGFGHGGHGR